MPPPAAQPPSKRRRVMLAFAVLLVAVALATLWTRRPPEPRPPGGWLTATPAEWAAHASAVMSMEAGIDVLRFGTPAAEIHEAYGFERVRHSPSREPSAGMKRRAEVRLRWPQPAPRVALLDLDVADPPPYHALRVMLNGHRVARLQLFPGRRRHRFELPIERQQPGVNALAFIFGLPNDAVRASTEPAPRAGRAFGLAVGPPSPEIDAVARAPLPFSAWAEGADLVQAGPSRLAWSVEAAPGARLRFTPTARGVGGPPHFRIEAETVRGARSELWHGGPGSEVTVDLPGGAGGLFRLWLDVSTDAGAMSWGTWKGLGLLAAPPPSPAPSAPPPSAALPARLASSNVIVVVLDAAGARHFGCYGHARRTTPEIDRIATEGVLFERAYTPAVFTRAAIASLWTSQLPDEHHASVSYDEKLPADVPTLAEIVTASGIPAAGFVGNNMAGTAFGLDRGFSEFYRLSYRAEVLREFLHDWLARNAGRRYFAYVHYREPHYPFDPRPPFDTLFGRDAPLPASVKTDSSWLELVNDGSHRPTPAEIDHLERLYDGNLAAVDAEVGRLRKHLEALGDWDRTAVIVTADHGEAMFEHEFVGHNEQVYEDSIRIPLIVRFPPGAVAEGRRVAALTGLLDVAPTIADILGIPRERTPSFTGRSLLAAAVGAHDVPPPAVLCRTVGSLPRYAWVGARYKYVYGTRDGDAELYDLAQDPGEGRNLIDAEPVRAQYARQRLFSRLLALPGRSVASPKGWRVPADQLEEFRALGYIQ